MFVRKHNYYNYINCCCPQMFDNIAALKFQKGPNNETLATGMSSAEKEEMDFHTNVVADGRVEDWMTSVLNEMRVTNRLITKESIFYYSYQKPRSEDHLK